MNIAASTSGGAIQNLALEFLELLPESTKRLVRLGSIPNAMNAELLREMAGEEVDTAGILETLQQYYFLNKGESGWYSFQPAIRELLGTYWKQTEHIEEFQNANRVATAYFDNLANQTKPPGNYVFQREALYHRLIANENTGLEYMSDAFERACDQRQIGAAQNFSIQLTQASPQLSPVAAQHAAYYEMRLDFLLNWRKDLQQRLETLIKETSDPLLSARAGILLGQVLLAQYEWKKSADILKSSLDVLQNLKAWRYTARAMLVLGDIYVDLVENCGGVQSESTNRFSRWNQLLSNIIFLPFLLLDWLKRKIWFMPGWFYSSANYQEWILNYLLQMAGRWYRKAWHMAQKVQDEPTSLKALFGQANVATQQRREAKAQRNYSRLARLPAVHSSDYRRAQVLYGQGQVSLLANHVGRAVQELQSALKIFRSFGDEGNIASVAHTLGTAYVRLANYEAAAQAFLESFQSYKETRDPLSQTQTAWELEGLVEKKQIPNSLEQPVKEVLSNLQEKHYLARFPSDLLRQFRSLAYWVALPLSYMLILIVGAMICLSLIGIEIFVLESSTTGHLSQSAVIFLLVVGILPIPLTFWIIELIYALVGQIWVFVAGHNSLNTLGEQPDRVILTSKALIIDRPGFGEPPQIGWDEIEKWVSADYRLWQRPIYLLSRQGLVGSSKSIILDGITSGYVQICKEITRNIGGMVNQLNADLVILAHRSTYILILLAMLHAQFLVSRGQISITAYPPGNENGVVITLFLSAWLVFFIVDLIMIFPPLVLWRIYLQRRFFAQQLGAYSGELRNFVRLSVVILLSIIALVWLAISPFLKIPGHETSQNIQGLQQTFLVNESAMIEQVKQNISEEQIGQTGGLLTNAPDINLQVRHNLYTVFMSSDPGVESRLTVT